jgi:hypothetical protein
MKKLLLLTVSIILLVSSTNAQNGGWREKEMEIRVNVQNKYEAELLYNLHLNGDVYSTYGLMYTTPAELEKIRSSGLSYEILKNDLNQFYENFWLKKQEQYRTNTGIQEKYHTYDEIILLMDSLVKAFPSICKKISFGTSVQGRQLCCLKISDHVNTDENEAEVLLDGGIHGDEIGAAENTARFARHLCANYSKDAEITDLINNREIWIYPMINPDGRVNVSRYNGNKVDVNRDWGYMWNAEGSSKGTYSQPETKAMRQCIYNNQFVIHLNCHSGSQNVFYPWCHRPAHAPDYNNLNTLAGVYASNSKYSSLVYKQSNADYATSGELEDCSYGINGSMGMVLEISVNKQPSETEMMTYYQNNVPAMMALLRYSGYGIEGTVTDSITGYPVAAVIYVDNFYPAYSDPEVGDYHRFVLAGTHSIRIIANGYKSKLIQNVVVTDKKSTLTDIKLEPFKSYYIYKVVSAAIPGNNPSDEGNTPAVIGPPDNINYSTGKSGTIILDMQFPVADVQGKDIKVIEGDNSPEGFSCYAGQSMDGPWQLLGAGTGTTDFDLSTASLKSAQFIKIVDDGDGTASMNDAGFDLDAIEVLSSPVTGIPSPDQALGFTLYPNPFGNSINVEYRIENPEIVRLTIYNALGEKAMVLTDKKNIPGKYSLQLNTSQLIPGIYYCKFETGTKAPVVAKCIIKL